MVSVTVSDMKQRITARSLNAYRRLRREVYIWDTEQHGLGIRTSPKGKLSWLFQRWVDSEARRVVIGHYPPMELPEARKKARALKTALPQLDQVLTLQEAFESYCQLRQEDGRYWDEVKRRFKKDVIPALGASTPITEIAKADVRGLINSKLRLGHKISARKQFDVLNPFFVFCLSEDYVTTNPLATLVRPKISKPRERVLSVAEIKAIWSAATELGYPFGNFTKLLLLTACRRTELAGIQHNEIEGNTLRIS